MITVKKDNYGEVTFVIARHEVGHPISLSKTKVEGLNYVVEGEVFVIEWIPSKIPHGRGSASITLPNDHVGVRLAIPAISYEEVSLIAQIFGWGYKGGGRPIRHYSE